MATLSTSFNSPSCSSSVCRGDGVIRAGSERKNLQNFGGNVSKSAAALYQADGLHSVESVQESLQCHLCQHGRTRRGQFRTGCTDIVIWNCFYLHLISSCVAPTSRSGESGDPDAQPQELHRLPGRLLHSVQLRHPCACHCCGNSQVSI